MPRQDDVGPDTELSARPYQRSSLASSAPSHPLTISRVRMGEKLNRMIKSEKDHIFKREIEIERAENGDTRPSSTDGASTSALSPSSSTNWAKKSIDEAPILIFLLFQKAIRSELDVLNSEAISLATGDGGDFKLFSKRFRFLFSIYEHHCNAEDEVIFPALDMRVKNVARTYSIEHQVERTLFNQLFELLNSGEENDESFQREIASCTGAIRTSLSQHMSKEEKQVFPLLTRKFTFEEQADLIWNFFCSIPVNMMAEFLPWLTSCISPYEHHAMVKCLCKIAPEQSLLHQVISSWMEVIATENLDRSCNNDSEFQDCCGGGPEKVIASTEEVWVCQHSSIGKRKYLESDSHALELTGNHPINEILHWHRAIKGELNEILEMAKKIQHSAEASDFSTFQDRLQFIIDICNFHRIAEDQVILPALGEEFSFVQEHSEEESQLNNFRHIIEKMQCTIANSSSAESRSSLLLHTDEIMNSIQRHFQNEEAEVLPLVRLHLCPEKQQELLYKSICVMPLKFLERAIPWFVTTLTEEESKSFLRNIQMAASTSDSALVTLLSGWASVCHSQEIASSRTFICLPSKPVACCPLENKDQIEEDYCRVFSVCPFPLISRAESAYLQMENYRRPLKRCNFLEACANTSESTYTIDIQRQSYDKQAQCAPRSGLSRNNLWISCLPADKSYHSIFDNSAAPSLNPSLLLEGTKIIPSNGDDKARPIDTIFKFHKAICKDLEYLDFESGKLLGCDDASLRQFSGRFRLLWSLYEAHSNAEDDIVFPALESREALHNVSHSYTLDHKQEEKLFADISTVIEELSRLQAKFGRTNAKSDTTQSDTGSCGLDSHCKRKQNELATKIQAMCKSLRISLGQHVFREELELWPLFDKHFSAEEQNRIVGRIIGITGAEILQSMLPWVTSALTLEEENCMMDTWKQATKNTMFSEWLNGWWRGTPRSSSQAVAEASHAAPKGTECQESVSDNDQMFKPGWKDIFRMNQNELEAEIRKVSQDPTLDPRRKAYLIQNLMTSRWIAAQQKSPQVSTKDLTDDEDIPGCSPSFRDSDKQIFGCEHYKRNCKLLATCCNKLFTCRFCHDKVSDHSMERKASTQMLCMRCLHVQPLSQTCKTPACNGFIMAKYFCGICKLFDDERTIYHCPFCNLCRVGKGLGIDFFHCMGCNFCLGMKLIDHKCREKSLETNCPICCDFLFTSTEPLRALRCGHFMHSACFQAYTCSHYTCPICSKSLGDMTVYFGMLDALLAAEELPEEYKDKQQDILCNDCAKKGKSRFHWVYHKCCSCRSYNTRVIKSEAK